MEKNGCPCAICQDPNARMDTKGVIEPQNGFYGYVKWLGSLRCGSEPKPLEHEHTWERPKGPRRKKVKLHDE